jgi:lipopolysaccharide transport system ATP-binding protein
MTAPAIEVDCVSKSYVIRHQTTRYLKDRLTDTIRRLSPSLRNRGDKAFELETFWALKDVSFRVDAGESVGIVGPNGSGKSTMLKILSGVTKQSSGRVTVHGKLGALIEVGAGFHPELTGRENVFLNGSILGMRKADIKRKFDAIVAFAEVEQFIDTPVKHYSSGMYVRLGFAIAAHNSPDILLVDEVLAVGDLGFQRKCFDKMRELKASGTTIVLISHSMPQVESLCGRAILLAKGKLVAEGAPREVASEYVAIADARAAAMSETGIDSQISITSVRLLDMHGMPTTRIDVGRSLVFEIDYEAHRPTEGVFFSLHIDRNETRVYDTDSRCVNAELGTLAGKGTLRCEVPNLRLTPNSFGIQACIYGVLDQKLRSHYLRPHMFSITVPEMFGSLDNELTRSIVFAPASWRVAAAPVGHLKTAPARWTA